jgi:hypothetical protein
MIDVAEVEGARQGYARRNEILLIAVRLDSGLVPEQRHDERPSGEAARFPNPNARTCSRP